MAHLTAMKRSLAAVSWSVSQEVGKVGREEVATRVAMVEDVGREGGAATVMTT